SGLGDSCAAASRRGRGPSTRLARSRSERGGGRRVGRARCTLRDITEVCTVRASHYARPRLTAALFGLIGVALGGGLQWLSTSASQRRREGRTTLAAMRVLNAGFDFTVLVIDSLSTMERLATGGFGPTVTTLWPDVAAISPRP